MVKYDAFQATRCRYNLRLVLKVECYLLLEKAGSKCEEPIK